MLADPQDPVRYGRCAARRAICAGARGQSRGDRDAVRKLVEGRRQARGDAGRILRLRLPLLQGEQPRGRPAAAGGQGPARRLSRAADPRPRQRDRGAAVARSVEARPLRPVPRRLVGGRAAGAGHDRQGRRRPPASPPQPTHDPAIEAELKRNIEARRPARRDRHALVRRRRPGDERRGRLRHAEGRDRQGRAQGS